MAQSALHPPSRHGQQVTGVLGDAAKALHVERDAERAKAWATDAALALGAADAARLCVLESDDTASFVSALSHPGTVDLLGAVGDPRSHEELLPVVRGQQRVRIHDLHAGGGGSLLARCLPGVASLLAVPVPTVGGMTQSVLVVAHSVPGRFSDVEEEAVAALGCHLGVALDNLAHREALEQLRATEREMVNQLQSAVMPATPEVPFTELGTYYSPADPGAHTGGDLHDWIVLPDGDLHLAVVDVMGKGVAATKDALIVTHALRLLALDGCPLDQLVRRANAIVTGQNPELVATVLIGRYRPATGDLSLAGGGHPPAVVVSGGRVRSLLAPGVPIGWPGAGSDGVVELRLGRSDTVILYTDGLIEAAKDIVKGLDALERFAAETARYPGEQQARILVERALRGASRRDDTLALVLRRRSPPAGQRMLPLGPFEHRLSPSTAAVTVNRALLREWLSRVPVDAEVLYELLLVATELCANAVHHASWERSGVVMRARVEGSDIVVEVEDDGTGVSWPHFDSEPPDPESETGRGLWLVRTFTDEATPLALDGRTVVRCVKRAVVGGG